MTSLVAATGTATTATTVPSPSWESLPSAPIVGRIAAGVVWTGTEMIVWGGVARSGNIEAVSDGAAYDPASRTWRMIAPAPSGVVGDVGSGAVWTGDEAVFWAGNSPDGPAAGAVYEPVTDTWRNLADGLLGPREGYSSIWTGSELLIISGTTGDTFASPMAAAVDPDSGSWRLLPALNDLTGLRAHGAVWSGQEAFVMGNRYRCPELGSVCTDSQPILVAYDPTADAVREIDLAEAPFEGDQLSMLRPIAWTGTEVAFTTMGDPPALVRYNPITGDWSIGSAGPCSVADASYTQTAWLGNRYVAACGSNRLQIYSPDTDTWRTFDPGPSPLNSRSGSSIVWTGTELIAWSGTVRMPRNPTPNDGASLTLHDTALSRP